MCSNNSYCLCRQNPDARAPVVWPAYSVWPLSHPLHGVEGCCLTTWSPNFLAQAFSGLGETLCLLNVFLLHLYNGKEEWGPCSSTGEIAEAAMLIPEGMPGEIKQV